MIELTFVCVETNKLCGNDPNHWCASCSLRKTSSVNPAPNAALPTTALLDTFIPPPPLKDEPKTSKPLVAFNPPTPTYVYHLDPNAFFGEDQLYVVADSGVVGKDCKYCTQLFTLAQLHQHYLDTLSSLANLCAIAAAESLSVVNQVDILVEKAVAKGGSHQAKKLEISIRKFIDEEKGRFK